MVKMIAVYMAFFALSSPLFAQPKKDDRLKNSTLQSAKHTFDVSAETNAFKVRYLNKAFPASTFKNINGKNVQILANKNKYVLAFLNCGDDFASNIASQVNAVATQYKADKNVIFITIFPNMPDSVKAFVAKNPLNTTIVAYSKKALANWGITDFCFFVFLNKKATVSAVINKYSITYNGQHQLIASDIAENCDKQIKLLQP